MRETRISPPQWGAFLEQFSRQHRGWLVSISEIPTRVMETDPQTEGNVEVENAALSRVVCRTLGTQVDVKIDIEQGARSETRPVDGVIEIRSLKTDDGADAGLRIDRADGCTMKLRFRASGVPEELDGLAESELPGPPDARGPGDADI